MIICAKSHNRGFTFIEAMVVIFLIVVVAVTFFSVFSYGTNGIIEAKKKLAASQVASEKMEVVRSLNYADIGTTAGMVRGVLSEREAVSRSSGTYYIFTFVQYIDDPYDRSLASDTTGMNDYKRVRIKATWEDDINSEKGVVLISNFSPPGIENDAGGGMLSINVLDNDMKGIGQATVHIVNSTLGINTQATTDDTGNIIFPSAPAGDKNYFVEISKDGYFPVQTYPPYPASAFNPVNANASVLEDQPTILNLYTGKTSKLKMETGNPFGESVPNVGYNLEGGMKIGDTVATPSLPVYIYDQNLNSGSSGENALEDLSYGTYTCTFNAVSGYEFLKLDPIDSSFTENNKFILSAGSDMTKKAVFVSTAINSLIITVADSEAKPVKGASVQLKNSLAEPYDKTLTTDDHGQVYFPEELPELIAGSYDLKITADGFREKTDSVSVSRLTKKTIQLTAE